jgi:hypothetical protein
MQNFGSANDRIGSNDDLAFRARMSAPATSGLVR